MRHFLPLSILALSIALAASPSTAHGQRRPGGGARQTGAGGPPAQMGATGSLQQPTLKNYEDVVTEETKSSPGLFMVHQSNGRVMWEIPKEMLGRVFLWQTE